VSALARVVLAWRARCVRVVRASASTPFVVRCEVCTVHRTSGTFSLSSDRLGGAARHTYIDIYKTPENSRGLPQM